MIAGVSINDLQLNACRFYLENVTQIADSKPAKKKSLLNAS